MNAPAPSDLTPFARLALAAIERDYPFHLIHLTHHAEDLAAPRELHPVFHGAYDWHSSVHGHWCLVRAIRMGAADDFAATASEVLDRRLTPERVAGEVRYLEAPERAGFERPYGLAWLLQLCAELREWNDARAARWLSALAPLERLAAGRIAEWLPRLPFPLRSGEHAQSAFALGLALDWANGASEADLVRLFRREAVRLYGYDCDAPIHTEPSGHDFLSPALGEADLMRRVILPSEFARWLTGLLPNLESDGARRWLEPVTSPDLADGKLSHLAGLNLSRAWMMEGIVASLDASSPSAAVLAHAAASLRESGLAAVTDGPYAATHWLGSFAMYLVTRRGIARRD